MMMMVMPMMTMVKTMWRRCCSSGSKLQLLLSPQVGLARM